MAVPFPAETSSSSHCFHQRSPCTFRVRSQSRTAFVCHSKSTGLQLRARRKRLAGASGLSANHTQTLVQTLHSSVLPAHSWRTYRDEGSLSELAIADYLLEERGRLGAAQTQTKLANAQPKVSF